jgi:archaellum component FlaD/FlaE
MTLPPHDDDSEEFAAVFGDGPPPRITDGSESEFEWAAQRSEGSLIADHHRELSMLQSMGAAEGGKPYLPALPADYGAEMLVFEWVEDLLSTAGPRGAVEALRYYESVEWLGADARESLEEYLLGVDVPERTSADLDREDHARSLVYVARLAAMRD